MANKAFGHDAWTSGERGSLAAKDRMRLRYSAGFGRTPPDIDAELAALAAERAALEHRLMAIGRRSRHLDASYHERGCWARAFLVDNLDGHVHRTTACRTCHPTTAFNWLTEYSGCSEDDIVAAAGELACTACFPTAPVEITSRPGVIRTEAQLAREQREAQRAKNRAAKQAKAIAMPDGSPLRDAHGHVIATERTAEIEAAAALADIMWYGTGHSWARDWFTFADRAIDALSAKRGQDVRATAETICRKAVAKRRRYGN